MVRMHPRLRQFLIGGLRPHILRRVIAGTITVPAALIVAAATLILVTDAEEVKQLVIAEATQITGRELSIAGDVEISYFPRVVVRGTDIALANASWASQTSMLTAKGFEIELSLARLLTGRIRVTRLSLFKPELDLETDAAGRRNWQFSAGTTKPLQIEDPSLPTAPAVPSVVQWTVRDGRITLREGASGRAQNLTIEQLTMLDVDLPTLREFKFTGAYNGQPVNMNGFVSTMDKLVWSGRGFSVLLEIDGFGTKSRVRGNVGRPGFSNLLRLSLNAKGPDVLKTFSILQAQFPALADMILPVTGAFKFFTRFRGPAKEFSLRDIKIELGQPGALELKIEGRINRFLTRRRLNLNVLAQGPDIRTLSRWAGIELPELPPFRLSGNLRSARRDFAIDNFEAVFGRSNFFGNLSIGTRGPRPRVSGGLTAKRIDVDEFTKSMTGGGAILNEFDKVDLGLKLVGKKVTFRGLAMESAVAGINLTSGKLMIEPFVARLLGGRILGSLELDAGKRQRQVAASLQLSGTDLRRVPVSAGWQNPVRGWAGGKLDLKGEGDSLDEVLATLNGTAELVIRNGELFGGPAAGLAQKLRAALFPALAPGAPVGIRCAQSEFRIRDGKLISDGALIVTAEGRRQARGFVNLPTGEVKFDLTPISKNGQPSDCGAVD